MTLKVNMANNGATGVDFVNDAGTTLAQVRGYDDGSTNGHLELYTTSAGVASEKVRLDKDGNVSIGTPSPLATSAGRGNLTINGSTDAVLALGNAGSLAGYLLQDSGGMTLNATGAGYQRFYNNGAERMRIDSSGNLLVGTTSQVGAAPSPIGLIYNGASQYGITVKTSSNSGAAVYFLNSSGTNIGAVNLTSTTTAYVTSSDYRLKENIVPMTGALSVVTALKPCTYSWKADGSNGQGFIAHELQAVVPDAVVGEKDAVDADGNPKYQGIDTSFLVATLTAAIQELKAELDAVKAQLENK